MRNKKRERSAKTWSAFLGVKLTATTATDAVVVAVDNIVYQGFTK